MTPGPGNERGFELAMETAGAEAAKTKAEMAVQGIHSHTGVYLVEELPYIPPDFLQYPCSPNWHDLASCVDALPCSIPVF